MGCHPKEVSGELPPRHPISCREVRRAPGQVDLLSLTLFVFGIFLVDHIEAALAANDFVLGGTLLDGSSYFHRIIWDLI